MFHSMAGPQLRAVQEAFARASATRAVSLQTQWPLLPGHQFFGAGCNRCAVCFPLPFALGERWEPLLKGQSLTTHSGRSPVLLIPPSRCPLSLVGEASRWKTHVSSMLWLFPRIDLARAEGVPQLLRRGLWRPARSAAVRIHVAPDEVMARALSSRPLKMQCNNAWHAFDARSSGNSCDSPFECPPSELHC